MIATYGDRYTKAEIEKDENSAMRYESIARTIKAAESDTVHMSTYDELILAFAVVKGAPGYDTSKLYKAEREADDKLPGLIAFANALSKGEQEAAKTEKM